jgi:hypothetical protein
MRHAAFAEMLAHRQTGLAAAYDKCVHVFDWHFKSLLVSEHFANATTKA